MKKLMNLMVLSCLKATFLLEKREEEPLSIMEKFQLKLHLKICDKCANYSQQSHSINMALKQKAVLTKDNIASLKLSEPVKTRIQHAVSSNVNKN